MEENMGLIDKLVCSQEDRPSTHLVPRKNTKQIRISPSTIQRMVKKKTWNSSSALKHHHKLVNGLQTEETLALAPIGKDLKITSIWSKKQFDKTERISLLKFLSICRTIVYIIKEQNKISLIKINLVQKTRCLKKL